MKNIVIDKLSKSFDGKKVLHELCIDIPLGKITCIKGESGCGKTTLLKIMAGLTEQDSGGVRNMPSNIAFMFQEDRLCEDFNAVSNVKLLVGKKKSKGEIVSHLCELGLGNDLSKPVKDYSGGMKRRVALARAVCFDSDALLLDEPFKGLDAAMIYAAAKYVKKHTKGKTVICVTHDDMAAKLLEADVIDIVRE